MASQQMEEKKGDDMSKLQRVRALGVHLNHHKRIAQEQHKCSTCDRPLNPATELGAFIRKQVSVLINCLYLIAAQIK